MIELIDDVKKTVSSIKWSSKIKTGSSDSIMLLITSVKGETIIYSESDGKFIK